MNWLFEKIKSYFNPEVKEIYLVEIIYKNGQRVFMWCSAWEVNSSNSLGCVTYLRLRQDYSDKYPNAKYGKTSVLHMGVADISSVWQVGSMKVKV
jgi:hypothetical protein